jgi:hypothetical protein
MERSWILTIACRRCCHISTACAASSTGACLNGRKTNFLAGAAADGRCILVTRKANGASVRPDGRVSNERAGGRARGSDYDDARARRTSGASPCAQTLPLDDDEGIVPAEAR